MTADLAVVQETISSVGITSGIYAFVDDSTGAAYIGSSRNIGRRQKDHLRALGRCAHSNKHLQRAWTLRGPFRFVVLEVVADTRQTLIAAEQRWMDSWGELYNESPKAGRPTGDTLTESHRRNISRAHIGRPKSPEAIERSRAARVGKPGHPISPELKERLRQINSSLTRSPELRQRISRTLTGRKESDSHRSAISDGLKKHYQDPDNRAVVSEHSKATWRDPKIRARRLAGIRAAASTPAGRARSALGAKVRWEGHSKKKLCANCGEEFTYVKRRAETCSAKCAHALAWTRRRERAAANV